MNENQPVILSIKDLLDKVKKDNISFNVPGYQRGYRWGKDQISNLIEDIRRYDKNVKSETDKTNNPYYLQPVIVKENSSGNNIYDVIDGQQRLTTIWLLLYYLDHNAKNKSNTPLYTISYDSRPSWNTDFLNWLKGSNTAFKDTNLDYFHIWQVYETIKDKIKSKEAEAFLELLLNHVKVIWSEVNYNNAIDKFTNVNSGKIKLTCAELIKALFLQENIYREVIPSSNANITNAEERLYEALRELVKKTYGSIEQRDKIAREWDEIERRLGEDKFWYFIYDQECGQLYDTRIEYIFNLVCGVERGDNPLKAFETMYDEILKEDNPTEYIEKKWKVVKKYVDTLYNWWKDKEMYHLIGYLISTTPWVEVYEDKNKKNEKDKEKVWSLNKDKNKKKINVSVITYLIYGLYEQHWTKTTLKAQIKKAIINTFSEFIDCDSGNKVIINEADESFTYSKRNNIIRALLFFNIDTMLKQKGDERFPFDRYKNGSWDIEHIASQTDFAPKNSEEKVKWCAALLQYFTGNVFNAEEEKYEEKIKNAINETMLQYKDKTDKRSIEIWKLFVALDAYINSNHNDVKEEVRNLFGSIEIEDGNKHKIGNLTLLNSSINRGYGNSIFPIKRMTIIQAAEDGYYIPICTQKVFQKAYSNQLDQLYQWTKKDFEDYGNAVKKVILDYCNK